MTEEFDAKFKEAADKYHEDLERMESHYQELLAKKDEKIQEIDSQFERRMGKLKDVHLKQLDSVKLEADQAQQKTEVNVHETSGSS